MVVSLDRTSGAILDCSELPIGCLPGETVWFALCHLVQELHRSAELGLGEIMELSIMGYSDWWRDTHWTWLVRSKLGQDCDCIIDPTLLGLCCSAVDVLPEG